MLCAQVGSDEEMEFSCHREQNKPFCELLSGKGGIVKISVEKTHFLGASEMTDVLSSAELEHQSRQAPPTLPESQVAASLDQKENLQELGSVGSVLLVAFLKLIPKFFGRFV